VEVHEVGFETYVARTTHNPYPYTMPEMSEGDFCLRLNDDTELKFSKQGDDTFDLSIKTDGDVSISAAGSVTATATEGVVVDSPTVKLGGDTGTKVVARKGDSVEVSDPLSGTLTGSVTDGASNTEAK
jgi:hypothetical protein